MTLSQKKAIFQRGTDEGLFKLPEEQKLPPRLRTLCEVWVFRWK